MEKFFIKNFQLGFWSLVLLWIANRLGLSERNTKYGKQVRCMTFSSYSCSSSRIVSQSYKEQHCNYAELREIFFSLTEAAAGGVLLKKVFSKILQHSQGITWVSFLMKLQASGLQILWWRGSGTGVFLWKFRNF